MLADKKIFIAIYINQLLNFGLDIFYLKDIQ